MSLNLNRAVLGIEFGSTRIKAVLIDENHVPVASGSHDWENQLDNGIWTYSLDAIWSGLQDCYADLKRDVQEKFGVTLTRVGAIGFSAMMHGYMAFNAKDELLVPFRTWRNTITGPAAAELTELFHYNIPQRWSISHLYQAILNGEPHVKDVSFFTTLAGYIHWQLTGRKVLGVGDASGMFPIDPELKNYIPEMIEKFDALVAPKGFAWKLADILPQVLCAGADAGKLTEAGAKRLDPAGDLEAGIPLCPPEGDAGTGMTATNAVAVRTGNVSAGTSVFAMVVLEKPLSKVYPEIDMVTTPTGKPVAMVHCNNCTSDINAWAGMLKGFCEAAGKSVSMGEIYTALFTSALAGDKDCGGVVNLPLFSGEPVVGLNEGRPMMVRTPNATLTFANFSRSLVAGAMSSLKLGMDILARENVKIDSLLGHGGYFKTPVAGQTILAASLYTPISVMETAGEGGPWGMALLAAYRANRQENQTLEAYLQDQVFAHAKSVSISPDAADAAGLEAYTQRFSACLDAQKAAIAKLS